MQPLTDPPAGPGADITAETIARLASSRSKFLGYIRRRISDADLAEDILQDCFLKAARSAQDIQEEEKLVPWFYRILRNAITDAYRRKAAETNRMSTYAREAESSITPEDENQICECINDLLPTLKPEYAEVTKAIAIDGEEADVVARRLGISRDNLKVRTYRARQALRKRLEETCRVCAVHHCLDCTCKQRGPSSSLQL